MEYIDTSSNPQPLPAQQPAQMRATGVLRVRTVEETKAEAFMAAKVTTARFYADHILSKAPGIRDSIVEGAGSVTAMALDAF